MTDILILGATGFTGRLVTRYLHNHPERPSVTLALGVRSKPKGEALKKSLGIDNTVRLVQVDVRDYASVEAAVRDARVVVNVVGPYWSKGDNVVRACAELGKRYVDLAGELHFIKEMILRYDYLASTTGAMIVPACGFNCIPADMLVFLANRALKSELGADAQLGLSQAFYNLHGGISGGSIRTMLWDMMKVPRDASERSEADYSLSQVQGHPSPKPALAARMPFSSQYGRSWWGDKINRGIVQRTFGLTALVSSYTRMYLGDAAVQPDNLKAVRALAYGPQFRYAEYQLVGKMSIETSLLSSLFSFCVKLFFKLLWCWLTGWFIRLFIPRPGQGPSDEELEKGSGEVTNYTQSATCPNVYAKSVVRVKGDPGYLVAACMVSESALALALDDASLPDTARLGGVLTPVTAFGDVLVRRLEATGRIHFESEVVRGADESRKVR